MTDGRRQLTLTLLDSSDGEWMATASRIWQKTKTIRILSDRMRQLRELNQCIGGIPSRLPLSFMSS